MERREAMLAMARWRAAEERLYPLALVDAAAYEAAVTRVRVVLDELRARCATFEDLLACQDHPGLLEKAAGTAPPNGADVVAAACALRGVEIAAASPAGRAAASNEEIGGGPA